MLNVPFFPIVGEEETRHFKNSYLSVLAEKAGVDTPMVMKAVQRPLDPDTWQEYRYELLRQLRPLEYKGSQYYPLHPTGGSRTVVAFIHGDLEEVITNCGSCSEDIVAYIKALTTTEFCYGLHRLTGVNLVLKEDEEVGLLTDGLGYISTDLLEEMGAKNIIQMRAFHSNLRKPGISKGLLKRQPDLPPRTIRMSLSQLKGNISKKDWQGQVDLDIGILRRFEGKPPKARDSWSMNEFHHEIRDAEVPDAVEKAQLYCDVMKDPLKLMEFRGLLTREDESLGLVEHLIKIAATSTVNGLRRPRLERHPFVATQIESICASRLRHLATSGSREFWYPTASEVMTVDELKLAVKTDLYPPGTEVAVWRYPVLEGRNIGYGIVVGPSDSPAEVSVGKEIAEICAMDSDGDTVIVTDETKRVELARRLREEGRQVIKKNHRRLKSSLYELPDVIAKNLFSPGVGTACLSSVSCHLAGDVEGRRFGAELNQSCTDSLKFDVNTSDDRRKAKELLDRYGLPDHLCHRDDKRAFSRPESTTPYTSSHLWKSVAEVYLKEMGEHRKERLPARAYANLLGNRAFDLTPDQLKRVTEMYRFYASKARQIHTTEEDDEEKASRFRDLYATLRNWKTRLDGDPRHLAAAAWTIAHSSTDQNSIGAFALRVFAEELVPLLAEVYNCRELAVLEGIDDNVRDKTRSGLRGHYTTTNNPVTPRLREQLGEKTSLKPVSIALVNLADGVSVKDVEAALLEQVGEVFEDSNRPLPAFECCGHEYRSVDGRRLCDLADADVRVFKSIGHLKGQVITFRNSLKVYIED